MDYFVGLDVSLRSCALCVVDTKGKVVLERELVCEVNDIAACLCDFEFPIERIGLEAGTMSQYLYFGLQAAGFDMVCMEARQVKAALSAMRNKTDKNDAKTELNPFISDPVRDLNPCCLDHLQDAGNQILAPLLRHRFSKTLKMRLIK